MPDEMEKRLRDVEGDTRDFKGILGRIADDIREIKADLQSLVDYKGRVEDHGGQLKKLWLIKEENEKRFATLGLLESEHKTCSPTVTCLDKEMISLKHRVDLLESKVNAAAGFTFRLFEGAAGKILWGLITLAAGAAAGGAAIKVIMK